VSLRLELASSSVKSNIIVDASFKLLIYDQSHGKNSEHLCKIANYFCQSVNISKAYE
jgi:hypothetical protein